ncbi:MAG TPA: hypothetical protein VFU15_02430 [Bacteroidia bacterium]|nr:hypothetical protein [Bacteroidia bacterium]
MKSPGFTLCLLCLPFFLSAQAPKWSTAGNATGNGDFIGTTNNNPLVFFVNDSEAMRIKQDGDLKVRNLGGNGRTLVTSNNNGVLGSLALPGNDSLYLDGNGNFSSISAASGWAYNGNNLYTVNTGYVGIGVSTPQFPLEVNGSAKFNGTLYANGLILANKLQADTIKGASSISVNNNLNLTGGTLNEMYALTGDVRVQSKPGYNGNTILNAGTNGNVGIGIFAPQYKLDVNGDQRVSGQMYIHRIVPLAGDSEIHFGDSSVIVGVNNTGTGNYITASPAGSVKGLLIGYGSGRARAVSSLAIGRNVATDPSAAYSIAIGSGPNNVSVSSWMTNNVPNSLMIGFNSTIPTLFVGPGSGTGTLGTVGIGSTAPSSLLQVNSGIQRINIDAAPAAAGGILGYVGFNAELNSNGFMHTTGGANTNTGAAISLSSDGSLWFNVLPNTGSADNQQDYVHMTGGTAMRIYSNYVLIGNGGLAASSQYNNDPLNKLMVQGRILCKDVVVSNIDWQDEVFDSAYTLMPLDSVGMYVKINRHLPGFRPEKEIESDGMSVSATAAAQQKQIEEMMLYILQINDRLKALEAENEQLKKNGGK